MKTHKQIKPFLKWAGGKRQLLPAIQNYIPQDSEYKRYYEPFIGGGALFFALQPKVAVINDSNSELINCYEIIRDEVEQLIEDLKQHKNEAEYYYNLREWDRLSEYKFKTKIQRASRIIYLNKTCYNGLFRVNSQGQFNVPFGRYKKPNFLEVEVLRTISEYLNREQITISNLDFAESLKNVKSGDFVYLDPPYDPVSDTASFTGYDVNKFNKNEQYRLKKIVDTLNDNGCKFLLSNARTEFIEELYQKYTIKVVSATRAINSKANKRGKIEELLVMNY